MALLAALLLAGCGGGERRVAREAPGCLRYCLWVEPSVGDRTTVFTFVGTNWRPRRPVEAHYGPFCDIRAEGGCDDVGKFTRFRADARGGFRFRFRNGPEPLRLGRASGNGSGPPVFEQWTGREFFSRLVRRTLPIVVDGQRHEVPIAG